ncbi:hypothetical protein LOK49_LG10G00469 [Camellia lanceoleosa]|uniref:Uncharacterized protein n=1 Tax=Camellia lanceoleosa TaxID=1840588 RepID=A0ACC0GAR9_9ERIC|nr:hypothetical protein LOK49_LG10G00469 [Camellia lanceoleosa]
MAYKFVSREEGLQSDYGPNLQTRPARSLHLIHSSPRRTPADVSMGSDTPASPLNISNSCTVARRQGTAGNEESGTATPTSHQLATNVEALSPDLDPPMRDSGLLSGSPHLYTFKVGPPNVVGEAQTQFNPSSEKYELPCSAPYFVTEPSEVILPISQPTVSQDPLSFRVQELSPSSSPVRPGPPDSITDLCISKVFNCLSLKRPLGEDDLCDSVVKKKLKGNILELDSVYAESKALSVVASQPPEQVLAKRVRRQRKTSLVEIQVQILEADATSISGGTGPVRIVSLGDTGCCPRFDKDDTLLWYYDSKGCYTVKSRYREAMKQAHLVSTIPSSSIVWSEKEWLLVWNLNLPLKLKHFLWKIYHNALATCQNLSSRRCVVSACCPVCFSASESIEHLLFDCEWSRRVWFGCDLGLRCDNQDSFSTREWFGKCFETLGTSAWGKSVLCSMVWVA